MGEKQRSERGDDCDLFHENVGMQSGQRVQTPDQTNKQTNKQELIKYGFFSKDLAPLWMGEKQRSERGDDRDLTLEDWLLIFIEFFLWNCDFTLEDRMPVFPLIQMHIPMYLCT